MDTKNHYIKNSTLNKAFIDKIKDYEIVEDLLEVGTALADLEESFIKILNDLRFKIECTSEDDYDNLLELFTDLWMELKHIDYHINQAEPGFLRVCKINCAFSLSDKKCIIKERWKSKWQRLKEGNQ